MKKKEEKEEYEEFYEALSNNMENALGTDLGLRNMLEDFSSYAGMTALRIVLMNIPDHNAIREEIIEDWKKCQTDRFNKNIKDFEKLFHSYSVPYNVMPSPSEVRARFEANLQEVEILTRKNLRID